MEERRITVRVSEAFHKAVRVKAAELGRPISDIVRKLLTLWLVGKARIDDGESLEERASAAIDEGRRRVGSEFAELLEVKTEKD